MKNKETEDETMARLAACERAIKEVLEEHECTLVYEERRVNGNVVGFEIKAVPHKVTK